MTRALYRVYGIPLTEMPANIDKKFADNVVINSKTPYLCVDRSKKKIPAITSKHSSHNVSKNRFHHP